MFGAVVVAVMLRHFRAWLTTPTFAATAPTLAHDVTCRRLDSLAAAKELLFIEHLQTSPSGPCRPVLQHLSLWILANAFYSGTPRLTRV